MFTSYTSLQVFLRVIYNVPPVYISYVRAALGGDNIYLHCLVSLAHSGNKSEVWCTFLTMYTSIQTLFPCVIFVRFVFIVLTFQTRSYFILVLFASVFKCKHIQKIFIIESTNVIQILQSIIIFFFKCETFLLI